MPCEKCQFFTDTCQRRLTCWKPNIYSTKVRNVVVQVRAVGYEYFWGVLHRVHRFHGFTGLHPVLFYVTPLGLGELVPIMSSVGLHPPLFYVTPSGLWDYILKKAPKGWHISAQGAALCRWGRVFHKPQRGGITKNAAMKPNLPTKTAIKHSPNNGLATVYGEKCLFAVLHKYVNGWLSIKVFVNIGTWAVKMTQKEVKKG